MNNDGLKARKTESKHWRDTDYGKTISIRKLVAEYDLMSMRIFPWNHCKARVWQEEDGNYIAYSNVGIIDRRNGYMEDRVCGWGEDIETALDDLISNNIELICYWEEKLERKLTDEDYCYSDPQDF